MVQKLTRNIQMKEQILKVQLLEKLIIHVKEKNVIAEKHALNL